jgi:hypothetical protein
MEDIQEHTKFALAYGLPGTLDAVELRISYDHNVIEKESWTKLKEILYSKDLKSGLLSGLQQAVDEAVQGVQQAWTAYEGNLCLLG